jgi:hypothetical protein
MAEAEVPVSDEVFDDDGDGDGYGKEASEEGVNLVWKIQSTRKPID